MIGTATKLGRDMEATAVRPPLLEMEGICKAFGHVQALQGVDFSLYEGEVVGLVGDNGAGKSTLIKIISGAYRPDAGTIMVNGCAVSFHSPRDAMTVGIAMDYTILILERCEKEMAAGAGLEEAVGTGVSRIGLAITVSGVTTILGFSSLLISDFSIISMFGSATVITIFFSLAGAILVMPAVIALMYGKKRSGTVEGMALVEEGILSPSG